jgi:hypothetical protein
MLFVSNLEDDLMKRENYVVSYKKSRSGRLKYAMIGLAASVQEASTRARELAVRHGWLEWGYREYGISIFKG